MKFLPLFISVFFFCATVLTAQDSLKLKQDTAKHTTDSVKLIQDSLKQPRRSFDSSLFSEKTVLTRSDYLSALEKVFEPFNKAPIITASFSTIPRISSSLNDDDTALSIIKERLASKNDRGLNLRNLQMFVVLLERLSDNTQGYFKELNGYELKLNQLKKEIRDLRKDTVIRSIFQDSLLRITYKPQLQQLKSKWKVADSVIKASSAILLNLKALSSAHAINIEELQYQADGELKEVGTKVFSKERKYLWEGTTSTKKRPSFANGFKKSVNSEQRMAQYYFSNTRSQRFMLIVTGLVFFFWIFFNFRSVKKRNKTEALSHFGFNYISPVPVLSSLIFMLCLAPLFDLDAPAIYIESISFFLMFILTIFFWKRLERPVFYLWGIFVILFLCLSFSRLLGLPFSLQRYWTLIINSAAFVLGSFAILRYRVKYKDQRIIGLAICLYLFLNFLAIFCNVFGRVTLTQIFGTTAIYAFSQTAALLVFVNSFTQASMLQIQSSRIRQKYPDHFDSANIRKGIMRSVTLVAVVIWLVVFTTNLNIYTAITDSIIGFLTMSRTIGSFSFTLSGLILFLGIIWAANFLQKYIGYFLGDTGDDAAFDNKGQRSRMLVTRLVLLIAGFLIAVAASGLAIDKITVILGALSVGIGLGLQSIVNNFVSGIILIFDRPLRIGDVVEIGDKKGRVKEIGIRSSTLLTADGAEVIIPNGDVLSQNIVNWTLSNNFIRMHLTYKIAKPFNHEELREALKEILKNVVHKPAGKEGEVFIQSINTSSAEIKLYFWSNDVVRNEYTLNEIQDAVQQMLEEKGIEIL